MSMKRHSYRIRSRRLKGVSKKRNRGRSKLLCKRNRIAKRMRRSWHGRLSLRGVREQLRLRKRWQKSRLREELMSLRLSSEHKAQANASTDDSLRLRKLRVSISMYGLWQLKIWALMMRQASFRSCNRSQERSSMRTLSRHLKKSDCSRELLFKSRKSKNDFLLIN